MRLLVAASEPVSTDLLREAAGEQVADAEVMLVAPATTASGLKFWVPDVDEAIAHAARERSDRPVAHFEVTRGE